MTGNLVNEDNYIRQIEYPKARELSLPIVPVPAKSMNGQELEALYGMYEDLLACIDIQDSAELYKRMDMTLGSADYSSKYNDPARLFLIGLAYLNGIEVEIDYDRAVELISLSADKQYIPALEKLAHMYRYGEEVRRSLVRTVEIHADAAA